ncbi:MAG: aldo/keto reductase, partial [Firmicutes bacterium]|nr:aldo/keto reductase [Bacillota bacterium]
MNKLGFGFLRLPKKAGSGENDYDWDLINDLTDRFLEGGGDYFDTCYTYLNGYSEMAIKRCLVERHPRGRFKLADKLPGYMCRSYEDCRKYFNEELERCGVDYFDVYMLHWLNAEHYRKAQQCRQFEFLQ